MANIHICYIHLVLNQFFLFPLRLKYFTINTKEGKNNLVKCVLISLFVQMRKLKYRPVKWFAILSKLHQYRKLYIEHTYSSTINNQVYCEEQIIYLKPHKTTKYYKEVKQKCY